MEIIEQIEEYLDYCQNIRVMSEQTVRGKKSALSWFLRETGIKSLSDLDNETFNGWIKAEVERGISARAINTRMANIIAFCRYHREMGLNFPLKIPLIRKLKEEPVNRGFYTREEIQRVLAGCSELAWLLIRISFDTGLRISELRNLRAGNFDGRRIRFIGKGRKGREVYIDAETSRRLEKYVADNQITDTLWVTEYSRALSTDEIRIIEKKAFKKAGFDNFQPHQLRHSFATDIQSKGATLLEMQKMLGHSQAQTTERYIHGLDNEMENLFLKYRNQHLGGSHFQRIFAKSS